MKMILRSVSFLIVVLIYQPTAKAQIQNTGWEAGVQVGTLVYQGDLSKHTVGEYRTIKPAIGLNVTRVIDPYFAVRAGLLFGHLSGDESRYSKPSWAAKRAFSFSTPVTELAVQGIFNPFGAFGSNYAQKLSPYLLAGIGASFVSVNRNWRNYDTTTFNYKSDVAVGLGRDTINSTPRTIAVFPVGGGLRYNLSPNFTLQGEASYRFMFTDYLDGFSYSVNPRKPDAYYGISVALIYRFGKYRCPSVLQ